MQPGFLVPGDRAYNITVQTYSESKQVTVQRGCFAIMFTNLGDSIASVNGMTIFPSATPATTMGDSRSIGGHKSDIYRGNITLSVTPGGITPLVEIVQLFYSDYQSR